MKNSVLSKLSIIALVIVLAACGQSKFTARQYHNRNWIKVDPIAVNTPEKSNTRQETAIISEKTTIATTTENVTLNEVTEKEVSVAVNEQSSNSSNTQSYNRTTNSTTHSADENSSVLEQASVSINETQHAQSTQQKPTADSDVMLILLVILSFLLPPLAIYLKDGGVTGLFWLTLIFCLLAGGLGFGLVRGYYFGLWGVSIILALLRVFDII